MAQSISQEALSATGLPGATAASRHAGATASGAPASGSFLVGDYVVDQTGAIYICTVAGTPGTWVLTKASNITGTLAVANGGTGVTTSTGTGSNVLSTNAVLTAPFESASLQGAALSGSNPAAMNAATSAFWIYTAGATANWAVNLTGCPTTIGQSVTFALFVPQGSTAYIPSSISINGTAAAASGLPANATNYNSIYTWWQGGTAPTSGDASTVDIWTFTVVCTASSQWYLLAAQTKF